MTKKYILLLLLGCVLGFVMHEFYRDEGIGVLRIGVECDYPPNNWMEDYPTDTNLLLENVPGHYAEGYDLQIAKLVAQELHAELIVKKIGWNDLIPALNRREIDAIFSGMLDTEERHKYIAFSNVYDIAQTEYVIVVNKASPYASGARTLDRFIGAKLVAQKNTKLDEAIDQIHGVIHVPPVNTVTEMLNMVVNNEVDGTVINYDTAQTYERKYPNLKLIRFPEGKGFSVNFRGICAGVRKGNAELLDDINAALSKISRRDRQSIMDHTVLRAINVKP